MIVPCGGTAGHSSWTISIVFCNALTDYTDLYSCHVIRKLNTILIRWIKYLHVGLCSSLWNNLILSSTVKFILRTVMQIYSSANCLCEWTWIKLWDNLYWQDLVAQLLTCISINVSSAKIACFSYSNVCLLGRVNIVKNPLGLILKKKKRKKMKKIKSLDHGSVF